MSTKDNYINQEAIDNKNNFSTYLDERGYIDLNALGAAAEAAAIAKEEKRKEQWELKRQEAAEEAKKFNDLMKKTGESVAADNAKAAEAAIKEETDKAAQAIKDKYNALHNVKEETAIEQGASADPFCRPIDLPFYLEIAG